VLAGPVVGLTAGALTCPRPRLNLEFTTDLQPAKMVFKAIYGASSGLAIAVFAVLAIRWWPTDKRPAALIFLGGALTYTGVLISVIFPWSVERHAAHAASIAATLVFILIGGVVIQLGLAGQRRQRRREHKALRGQHDGSAGESRKE
jgi:hypothetical protein